MNRVQGLYIISVAAQILQMHPQTLRKYERAGFIEPPRMGTLRLYSQEDIARLRLIKHLVEDLGLNLSGVELALELTTRLVALRSELASKGSEDAAIAEALQGIDEMLLRMGFRVAGEPRAEDEEQVEPVAPPGRRGRVRIGEVVSLRRRV